MPFTTRNGVRIHFQTEGNGPSLLLHAGAVGDGESWRLAGYVRALRPDFHLILMDPRGRGKSDRPRGPGAHRIEEYREDVRSVLDELHRDRAVLVGASDGSKVCAAFAEKYPERVAALIDIDGLEPRDLTDPDSRDRASRLELAQAARKGEFPALFRQYAKDSGYTGPESVIENLATTDPEMIALDMEAWREWEGPASVLRRLEVPVLLLQAEKSYSTEEREAMARMNPRSEVRVIPDVGHVVACLTPDLVVPHLRSFLSKLRDARLTQGERVGAA